MAGKSEEATGSSPEWLVVDDNPSVLQMMATLVHMVVGARVRSCASGAEALSAFREAPEAFALVITDLDMPDMNGMELCQQMRAISPRQKILLTTGNIGIIDDATARLMGFSGLLQKPFSLVDLNRAIAGLDIAPTVARPADSVPS